MPRGGKRPGAGAPKGNLNALKHGRHSTQLLAFTYLLLRSPAGRKIMSRLTQETARGGNALHKSTRQMARRIEQKSIRQELHRRIQEILEKDYF
jgi:hypothetical protein